MEGRKLFAGARLRNLRQAENLTQRQFAERLGISTSYVNQLENNQRPLSAGVILALVDGFGVDIARFAADDGDRIVNDLHEALSDPIFAERRPSRQDLKIAITNTPDFAHAFLTLQRAYQAAKDRMASLDDALQHEQIDALPLPYEEVRDFFNYANNYIDWLDRGAEALATEIGLEGGNHLKLGTERLRGTHGMSVVFERGTMDPDIYRIHDPGAGRLLVNADAPRATQSFQIWQQIALAEEHDAIERILDEARFRSREARSIARIGLANYFAGAAMLPYGRFLSAARGLRHDIELLAERFGASLEQVAHRLSTLQRPGARGVPFFFLRVDRAGTITKRHSATRLQFARFGGACPLWGVHQAFERPGEIVRQLAETPDGERYISIARTITKRGTGFRAPIRRYAIALGCPVAHAPETVYSDGLAIDRAEDYDLIGSSCRICERRRCPQRSVPPIHGQISVDARVRRVVPFEIS
ncbi:helix-turn-helix domain-containing protein [Mangrovicoccus algicola]|uniref:DUF2083 domain-containing protein n=1 Tax=Mangrovicoccus algicola TaxID=2771008 RepID=A0A8J6YPP4_9RHOB|nr:DUF2083 domain-containing protein [Mangrovicoccus algicola]